MGQTVVSLTIHGPTGSRTLEGLADTAATFTKVPRLLAEALGLRASYETLVELGDGRTITRALALAEVELEGVRRPVLVALAENGERALVGYTTLEILGFKINSMTHSLEKTTAIELKSIRAAGLALHPR